MKQTKLSDIIEKNVDDKLYLKKKDFEKRKYLKISLYRNCTINGDIVDFAETLKQAKHNSRNNFWKSEYKFNRIYI